MPDLTNIIIGSVVLSFVHAAIPNHWLPLVAISRSEGWSRRETLCFSSLVSGAHVLGTILVGVLLGLIGASLSKSFESLAHWLGPTLLMCIGAWFTWSGLKHAHSCKHHQLHLIAGEKEAEKKHSRLGLIFSLSMAMFFSPCFEIEAYFLSVSPLGWRGILTVSILFFVVTISTITLLVDLAHRGIQRWNWKALDHHGKTITGIVLLLLGVMSL